MHYWTQCIIYFESFIHLTFRFLHFAVTSSVRADLQKIQNHENHYNDCEKSVFNIQRIRCIFFHNFTNEIALKLEKERKYLINKLFKFSRSWIRADDTHATKFTQKNNRQALTMVSAVQQKKNPHLELFVCSNWWINHELWQLRPPLRIMYCCFFSSQVFFMFEYE